MSGILVRQAPPEIEGDSAFTHSLLRFTLSRRHFAILNAVSDGIEEPWEIVKAVRKARGIQLPMELLSKDLSEMVENGLIILIDPETQQVVSKSKRKRRK